RSTRKRFRQGRGMRDQTRDPIPFAGAWFAACCVLAVAVVYRFEQQFYESIAVVSMLILNAWATAVHWLRSYPAAALEVGAKQQPTALLALSGFLLGTLGAIGGLILYLVGISVALLLFIPFFVGRWLATNPGPARYPLDLILVLFIALLLFGVVFPILWRIIE